MHCTTSNVLRSNTYVAECSLWPLYDNPWTLSDLSTKSITALPWDLHPNLAVAVERPENVQGFTTNWAAPISKWLVKKLCRACPKFGPITISYHFDWPPHDCQAQISHQSKMSRPLSRPLSRHESWDPAAQGKTIWDRCIFRPNQQMHPACFMSWVMPASCRLLRVFLHFPMAL